MNIQALGKEAKRSAPAPLDAALAALAAAAILLLTLYRRPVKYLTPHLEWIPFWSYERWYNGNTSVGIMCIENIFMFIPLGFFLPALVKKKRYTVLICFCLSLFVETIQYFGKIGLSEVDDLMNNTLGGVIGALFYRDGRIGKKLKIALLSGMACACAALAVFMHAPRDVDFIDQFSFEIRRADGAIEGYQFVHDDPGLDFDLVLKSETETILLDTETHLPTPEAGRYFAGEKDYSHVGFRAEGAWDANETYELFIRLKDGTEASAGQYLRGSQVLCTGKEAPPFHGTLLVSRPDVGFYVYQDGKDLYWLADENAAFEPDGITMIQCKVWTNQIDKLPEGSRDGWANHAFFFEKNELEPSGHCRVAKTTLPDGYAITTLATGYFQNGRWVWQEYFRPILEGVFF